jgi:hypothetical protein
LSSGTIYYDPKAKIYLQRITLANSGATAVSGPVYLVVEDFGGVKPNAQYNSIPVPQAQ